MEGQSECEQTWPVVLYLQGGKREGDSHRDPCKHPRNATVSQHIPPLFHEKTGKAVHVWSGAGRGWPAESARRRQRPAWGLTGGPAGVGDTVTTSCVNRHGTPGHTAGALGDRSERCGISCGSASWCVRTPHPLHNAPAGRPHQPGETGLPGREPARGPGELPSGRLWSRLSRLAGDCG